MEANSVQSQLDAVFENTIQDKVRANNYTDYIEYYLPSDVNELDASKLSYVFEVEENKVIMNINVSHIINSEYYNSDELKDEGYFDETKLIYSTSGSFKNLNNEDIDYFFKAYQYDNYCLLYLLSDEVELYGYTEADKSGLVTSKMLELAEGCNVKNDLVIAEFSNKDVIDYEKSPVNLFDNVFPVDGRIDDMMIDKPSEVSE